MFIYVYIYIYKYDYNCVRVPWSVSYRQSN